MSIPSRFEQDLKLLTREQLTAKYGEQDWDHYYELMREVQNSGIGPPSALPEIADRPSSEPNAIDDAEEIPEAELPPPPYRGRAFGRFVMIRRLEHEHSGRLVLPSRIAGTSDVGWVASTGEECKYIKQGWIVAFDQYASVGRELRLTDENGLPGTFLIVEEPDILAVLEKV